MKFDEGDRADESQVEDRRGMRFPGGGVGLGVGGLGVVGGLIYLVVQVLASNGSPTAAAVERLIEQNQRDVQMGPPVPPGQHQNLSGSCAGVSSTNDPAKFVVCVESNVQSFWRKQLAATGEGYRPARLVLFTDATPSGCGTASAETGPFYCPPDGRVYLDLGFFDELQRRFHARGGDFAEAYVIAHEYGHRVQDLVGTERQVRRAQEEHPEARGSLSVGLELQADCYAGVWGHAAYAAGKVGHEEIAEALDAAAAIGDDRIQKQALGRVNPETFTHGSSADRQKWFTAGLQTGDPAACNTFKAAGQE
ncbi:MAG TPA: neutral zinc metallopeptidase [Polyangia bacterium]|nr:neutral zinc metallopeptidase [Polyangia bacterium]